MNGREFIKGIVWARIYNPGLQKMYDGLDMSGYNNSFYTNMGLLARFEDLLVTDAEKREGLQLIPVFWKGRGKIVDAKNQDEEIRDVGDWSTLDIITEIIYLQRQLDAKHNVETKNHMTQFFK